MDSTKKLKSTNPNRPQSVLLPMNLRVPNVMPKAEAAGSAKPRGMTVKNEECSTKKGGKTGGGGGSQPRTSAVSTVMEGAKKKLEKRMPDK